MSTSHGDAIPGRRPAELQAIADDVKAALHSAGLPFLDDQDHELGGVRLEIDSLDDPGAGVYVSWVCNRSLIRAAQAAFVAGDEENHARRLFDRVGRAMEAAILDILDGAGFRAVVHDDTAPGYVQVYARQ